MNLRLGTLTMLLTFAATVPVAADQPPPKPLRHLSYDVSVGVNTLQDLTNYNGHMTSGKGSLSGRGSIVADVLSARSDDKSLVVRVEELSDTRKAPPVTILVLADGRVSVDPKDASNMNEEEQALVGFLGRAIVSDHDLSPGSSWKVSMSGGGSTDETTYRVDSMVGDDQVNLDFERAITVAGAQPMQITITGKVLYNYKLSVPVTATIAQHVVVKTIEAQNTSDLSFEYHLREDSLAGVTGSR
jgi:hypothetical protein